MPTDIDILRKIDRIHPYPAKFPVDLAMNYISKYTNIGNTVYDPFVGSGTTLLASRALERNAYGTDVNHIAVLISQFKLLSLSQNDIKELWDFIARFENSFFDIVKTVPRFYYKSIDHWFCADAITVLSVIKSEISKLGKNEQKIFCNLVFSSIINTVSNQEIINLQNNIMTEENALHIITSVWGLPLDLMEKTSDGNYFISNKKLYDLLIHHSSMSVKSIFFLSTALILSNQAREPICTIKWSDTAIRKYIKNLSVCNYSVTDIEKLSLSSAKEDVVTFCSVELYKKLKFDLLAVSYPGAQGDRCVLTGSGRNVLRTYIDIIACGTDDNGVTVYLEECKANIADSQNDAEKLNEFITNPEKMKGLEKLYHKVTNGKEKFDISIGIGAKTSPAARALDVDYIFMFDIDDTAIDKTVVRYNIAIIDTALINKFSPLINENGKLAGELSYPEIYVIQ